MRRPMNFRAARNDPWKDRFRKHLTHSVSKTQPKTPSTTMAPGAQAIRRVSARSWPRRATSGRLIIALIAEAMMAPIPATWGSKVPAATRLAAEGDRASAGDADGRGAQPLDKLKRFLLNENHDLSGKLIRLDAKTDYGDRCGRKHLGLSVCSG
jgi:hypothetical protein